MPRSIARLRIWALCTFAAGCLAGVAFSAGPGDARGQPSPSPLPTVFTPGSAIIAPDLTVVFTDRPLVPPTPAPGQTPLPLGPGCAGCPHTLFVHNRSSRALSVTLDSTGLDVAAPGDVVLQIYAGLHFPGSSLEDCATVAGQGNHLHCTVRLGPPAPTLGLTVAAVAADSAAVQEVQLPSADGNAVALVGPQTPPERATGVAAPAPVLMLRVSGRQSALRWDGSALRIEAPAGMTAVVYSALRRGEIPCERVGPGSNILSCPLGGRSSDVLAIGVLLPAGWNLIAAPDYTAPAELAPLYTYRAGAADYDLVEAGAPLRFGAGYWVYYATPGPPRPIATGITSVAPQPAPPGQPALIGNALYWPALVRGATAVYRYDPASGYFPVDELYPGEGAWVYSDQGSVTLVPITPTPAP